jgi:ubiquinone/menaquinone biosynthesis C-methylase UbiE
VGSQPPAPGWSDIAGWYDDLIQAGSGPHETAVACTLRLVGDLAGQDVLDIACGQGLAARALDRAGARSVTGVDSSSEMLARARGYERTEPHGVTYVEDDAQTLGVFPDGRFDGVNCQLGLMDIADLAATLAAVHRVLRPGGWFTFVIGHPCFLAPEATTVSDDAGRPARRVNRYFDECFWRSANPQGVRRAGNHHRPLATYLNSLIAAGFVIDTVDEPRPAPRLAEQQPEYAQVPIFWATRSHRT